MIDLKTVVIVAATLFVMYLALKLCTAFDLFGKKTAPAQRQAAPENGAHCPLCGTVLLPGQQLHSRIFGSVKDSSDGQRCNVMGCPACYPKAVSGLTRTCPVCRKAVAQDGFLIARLFTRTKDGKPHVIVTGCPNCGR